MQCPRCEHDCIPTEVDREAELAMYECEDCLTSWHVDFGAMLRGGASKTVVQDDSTLHYLVTNESTGSQETVPGWRRAVQAMQEMLNSHVGRNGAYNVNRPHNLGVELSASPDPQHVDGLTYFPHFHVNVSVSYERNVDL